MRLPIFHLCICIGKHFVIGYSYKVRYSKISRKLNGFRISLLRNVKEKHFPFLVFMMLQGLCQRGIEPKLAEVRPRIIRNEARRILCMQ